MNNCFNYIQHVTGVGAYYNDDAIEGEKLPKVCFDQFKVLNQGIMINI
jgi:hypothetical protein